MKKRILLTLLLAFSLVLALAFVVSAEENVPQVTDRYYVVQSMEGEVALDLIARGENVVAVRDLYGSKTAQSTFLADFSDGSHIELTLAENLVTSFGDDVCILINRELTITVIYNGYIHATPSSAGKNGFYLTHHNAKLRMIGSHGAYNEEGVLDTTFTNPTISNGVITGRGNLDIYHAKKVYAWVDDGVVYAENMRTNCGEEFVFAERDNDTTTDVADILEAINCACYGYSTAPIGIRDSTDTSRKMLVLDKCYLKVVTGAHNLNTLATGTYVKNTIFDGNVKFDAWNVKDQLAIFEGCVFKGSTSSATGRVDLLFKDCTFEAGKPSPGSDGGGKQHICYYTSADCENSATMTFVVNSGGTFNSYEEYAAYSSNKLTKFGVLPTPAKGHNSGEGECLGIFYNGANGFFDKGSERYLCVECQKEFDKENALAPIFTSLGIARTEGQSTYAVIQDFSVNKSALDKYNAYGKNTIVGYGLVAGTQLALGENAEVFENGEIKHTKAAVIDFSKHSTIYQIISIRISGLEGSIDGIGPFADLSLYCGAFILVNDGQSIVSSYVSLNAEKTLVVSDTLQTTFTYNSIQ